METATYGNLLHKTPKATAKLCDLSVSVQPLQASAGSSRGKVGNPERGTEFKQESRWRRE